MNNIPNIFWRFYDLYRRNKITLEEFSQKTNIDKIILQNYLFQITNN